MKAKRTTAFVLVIIMIFMSFAAANASVEVHIPVGSYYSYTFWSHDDPNSTAEVADGALPPGLGIDRDYDESANLYRFSVRGTPTATGAYHAVIALKPARLEVTYIELYYVVDGDQLVITTTELPHAVDGQYYSAQLQTNYPAGSVTFREEGSFLGSIGLSLSESGLISGTAKTPGTYSIAVAAVAEGAPNEATTKLTLVIEEAPDPTPTPEMTPEPSDGPRPSATPGNGDPTPRPTDPPKPSYNPQPPRPTPRPTYWIPTPPPHNGPTPRPSSGGRTTDPNFTPTPTPQPSLTGYRLEADSILRYAVGADIDIVLVSGLAANSGRETATGTEDKAVGQLPPGITVQQYMAEGVIKVEGVIRQEIFDSGDGLSEDGSFVFSIPIRISDGRTIFVRYHFVCVEGAAAPRYPAGTAFAVPFGG